MHKRHYEKFADGSVKDIEDEIPFDIPDGWSWCRLGEITSEILYGVNESAKETGEYKLLRITDIQNDSVNWDSVPFTNYSKDKVNHYLLQNNDIVFARTGATVGKSFLIKNLFEPAIYASYLIRIRVLNFVSPQYIKEFFGSPCYWNQITNKSSGIGQPNVNGTSLANLFIPLPALTEQQLIVAEIEKIFAQIDLLEQNKTDLQTAIKQAKSKILDLAIHGKLVSQDPNDEPASVLLEKICAEKEAKIAKGELKRDKNDSYIYKGSDNCHYQKNADGSIINIEDEIPFEVPDGWYWVRLNELADIARGGSPRPIENFITDDEKGINWIKIGDTAPESKYITSAKEKIISEGKNRSRFVHAGDFLLTNSMSFGRPYILKIDGCIHDGWLVFADIKECLYKDFLYYALSSLYIYNSFSLVAAGSTVKNLKSDTVKQVLFPLPPLAEQNRIVAKIEELFSLLDSLENNLV